jgi:hypothetical protein
MSDNVVAVPFIGEYELSVDDLREQDIVARSAAWRAKTLVSRWAFPVLTLAITAVIVFVNQEATGCFIPDSTPPQAPYQVWLWQCDPTETPGHLVWDNTWMFAATGALWLFTLADLARAWFRPPRWLVRWVMKRQELQGRFRYEVAADGFTAAEPDGFVMRASWQAFIAVRETPERFYLFGRKYKTTWVLPKRALSDQSAVQQLGEFLRASVTSPR